MEHTNTSVVDQTPNEPPPNPTEPETSARDAPLHLNYVHPNANFDVGCSSSRAVNAQPSSGQIPLQYLTRMPSSYIPFWNGYQYINPVHFPIRPAFGYPGIPAPACTAAAAAPTAGLNEEDSQAGATTAAEASQPESPKNLREWMESKGPSAGKPESLRMFMRAARIVDGAHRQGMGLLDLRPSSFALIEEIGDVKYVGPILSDESKGIAVDDDYFGGKAQKVGEGKSVISDFKERGDEKRLAELEKGWYGFPVGHVNGDLPFFNVYCLGLLLFEFESIGEHHGAMVDLRQRILPPQFVSRHPEEARFCFRLLHQEPLSRPTTREIMQFVSLPEQPETVAAVVEDADDLIAESDLLLHFLSSSEESKRAKALTLSETIRLLDSDIHRTSASRTPTNIPETSISSTSAFRDRILDNIDDLEAAYFSHRSRSQLLAEKPQFGRPDKDILRERPSWYSGPVPLSETENRAGASFDGISKLARHNRFEVCGGLRYYDSMNSGNSITSMSIDRDDEFLATAGALKKIKIFEVGLLLGDDVDVHCPVIEFSNESKFSCVCWNTYIKNYLVSTDYDGVVQIWDAGTGQGLSQYKEHDKRAWSVDFSKADPTKFASGSDDCSIRIWSTSEKASVGKILNRANVCCVQFSPYSSHLLTYGTIDHKIYCYDLRHTKSPWCTIEGHGGTVSCVMFLDSESIVSASTDNTLKLWDLNKTTLKGSSTDACTLTFRGHTNENNLIGMTVLDGYIACGSETNEVYAYHRSMPMPIVTHKFESIDDGIDRFVSSVCWRKKSEMLVAANSRGNMYMLRMV